MTRGQFTNAITMGLGATVTLHTRRALAAEAQAEGGAAKNNLFNTTQKMPNSTTFNSAGVQNYATPEEGIAATIKTLKYDGHGYGKIRRALRDNATATVIVRAFGESDWGTDLTIVLAVLDDIKHNRAPNMLPQLESRPVNS
jgi:hypothetical protein